jgi:RHS repeat-associated protein
MSDLASIRDIVQHDPIEYANDFQIGAPEFPGRLSNSTRGDIEAQASNTRTRWYSPTLETWTQQDPAGYVDDPNLYEFQRSNPARYLDPLGLAPEGGIVLPGGGFVGQNGEYRPDPAPSHQNVEDWLRDHVKAESFDGCKCSCRAIKAGLASIYTEMMRNQGLIGKWVDNRGLQIYLNEGRDTGASLGPGQMKLGSYVQPIIDGGWLASFLNGPTPGTRPYRDKVADLILNNPAAVACSGMQKLIDQWEAARSKDPKIADIRDRVDILGTLYNLGFGMSVPKPNPMSGGNSWPAADGVSRPFGDNAQMIANSAFLRNLLDSIGCHEGNEYPKK